MENDTFCSIVDIYDWFSILFAHSYGMSIFRQYYVTGLTDWKGNVILPILFENEYGLFISAKVFEEKIQLESIDFQDISLGNCDDCFSELSWGYSLLNNIRPFSY